MRTSPARGGFAGVAIDFDDEKLQAVAWVEQGPGTDEMLVVAGFPQDLYDVLQGAKMTAAFVFF